MNLFNFLRLPHATRGKLLHAMPTLKVNALPIGNKYLLTPLQIGEQVENMRNAVPGKPEFITIKHGPVGSKTVSIFHTEYFVPVNKD